MIVSVGSPHSRTVMQNAHTSPEAKRHAREILEAHGYTVERAENVSEDEHDRRVLAGYKAALNSKSSATGLLNQVLTLV